MYFHRTVQPEVGVSLRKMEPEYLIGKSRHSNITSSPKSTNYGSFARMVNHPATSCCFGKVTDTLQGT